MRDYFLRFVEATETYERGGENRVAGSRIRIETNRFARLLLGVFELTKIVVLLSQAIVRRAIAWIGALPKL